MNSIFDGVEVGGIFESTTGEEIPVNGDKARLLTLADEVTGGTLRTLTELKGDSGIGEWYITAKGETSLFSTDVGTIYTAVDGTEQMLVGDKARFITLGTEAVGDDASDFDTLVAGGAGSGAGLWEITAKGGTSLFTGDVGDVFLAVGDEIMLTGDTAKPITLGGELSGRATTFDEYSEGDGSGPWYITAEAETGSVFEGLLVGEIFTATGDETMAVGDKAQQVTLGDEVIGEDVETALSSAYLFDFDVAFDLAFCVSVTAADGTPKTPANIALTFPAVGQVLVTYTTVVVGDVISVVAQRASDEKSSVTAEI
jgi:hypothetical protein